MYQELEMYKEFKKEKQLKHKHEQIASVSALIFLGIIAIIVLTFVNQFTIVNIESVRNIH